MHSSFHHTCEKEKRRDKKRKKGLEFDSISVRAHRADTTKTLTFYHRGPGSVA